MNSNDRDDSTDQELELKRYSYSTISPLERFKMGRDEYRQLREEQLREVIKGPSTSEDWHRAQEELRELRSGMGSSYDMDEEFGR